MTQDPSPPTDVPGSNLPELTVSEISQAVRRTMEQAFGRVRVRGEISQSKYHSSGHLYLTLKDDRAILAAVCWRGTVRTLAVRAEDGLEVVCTGRLTTYDQQSKYQLVIESLEPAGRGAIQTGSHSSGVSSPPASPDSSRGVKTMRPPSSPSQCLY